MTTTDTRADYLACLQGALDNFQWAYPDRSQNRGEVMIDPDDDDILLLIVWTHDNESNDEEVHPLEVRQHIDFLNAPENNIRLLIHGYLTHEADEQMFFGPLGECLFYPHDEVET